MKIANIYSRFKTMSGGPVFLLKLAEHVTRLGHEFLIITRHMSDRCTPYVPDGVTVITPKGSHRTTGVQLIDSAIDLALAPRLARCVPEDTDIICVHSDAAIPSMPACRSIWDGTIPCAYYCYQPTQFAYNLTWQKAKAYAPLGYLIPLIAPFYRLFDKHCAKRADSVIAFSQAYREWCSDLYGKERTLLVPPGADASFVDGASPGKVRTDHGIDADTRIVLTVNKLICQKNIDLLIRATAIVRRTLPNVVTIIVGDGPEKGRLTRLAASLNLDDSIIFTGFLKEWGDVCNYYAACDAYAFLEKDVPFGMTVVEAGNFRKPSIAVASGGALDTVDDGNTGILVGTDLSVDEIAAKILVLLEDRDHTREMGQKAKAKASLFSWESCAHLFCRAMEETITARGGNV